MRVFVGRERELHELALGLDEAVAGSGRVFLLAGEPGIGKSRLADEFASAARRRGVTVLWGRCWEAGGAPAYWPWVESIRAYIRACDRTTLVGQLGPGGVDLVQLFPDLRELVGEGSPDVVTDPDTARFRLFESMSSFLVRASEASPLVFVLDDVHAADASSLLLLRFLAGAVADSRIFILATLREEELHDAPGGAETLAALTRERATRTLRLGGLDRPAVARFIESEAGIRPSDAVVNTVSRETDGNPLFLTELVRLFEAEGTLDTLLEPTVARALVPRRVREAIQRRLAHLSPACVDVLRLASVMGRDFSVDVIARASDLPTADLLGILDEAISMRIVVEVPGDLGRLRYGHALVRDAVYAELSAARRVELHRLVGETLEAVHAPAVEAVVAELAHHFSQASRDGDVQKAIEYGQRAGDWAVALLAYEEAVRLYRQVLTVLERGRATDDERRCDVLLALGDAQMRCGDTEAARESFLGAAEIGRARRDAERLGEAALGYGGRFVWARSYVDPNVVPLLEDAIAAAGEEDTPLRVRLLARLAGALRDRSGMEAQDVLSRRAVEMARRIGDPATLAYALDGRYAAVWRPDNTDERLAIATEIIHLAERVDDKERAIQGHDYRSIALMERGQMAAVDAEINAVTRLAKELRQPAQSWIASHNRAMRALLDGRFDDAERHIQESLSFGERSVSVDAEVSFALQSFILNRELGRLPTIESNIRTIVREHPTLPLPRCLLVGLLAELGRGRDARVAFEELATDDFGGLPWDNEWLVEMALLSEVATFLGDRERASTMHALLGPFAAKTASTSVEANLGSVARYLGLLAETMRRREEAEAWYEAALEMNTSIGARPWVARTQYDYARLLQGRDGPGDHERAISLLSESLATARELGMISLEMAALDGVRATAVPDAHAAGERVVLNPPRVFRREGEYWAVSFDGRLHRLKDSKGLRYLAHLLGNPGRELHVLHLVALGRGPEPDGRSTDAAPPGPSEPGIGVTTERGEAILDARAAAAYRERLNELEDEIREAEAWSDIERAARLKEEREFLTRELAAAFGLGGRARTTSTAAERARINVTKAIRSALSRIGRQDPSLGAHLDRTIRTGTFCSYQPDPASEPAWEL